MSDFYKILKDTRIQRGIELEEIQTRTKINIKFLIALENGEFDLLPKPYIRLFFRAYSTEIGLNPEKLLNQFEQIDRKFSPKLKKENRNKISETLLTIPKSISGGKIIETDKTPKIKRGKMKLGLLLLSCWIFGIIIISKITNLSTHPDSQLSAMDYINNLNTKYIKGNLEEHLLEFPPPYSFTIKTVSHLSVFTSYDSTNFSHTILNRERNEPFYIDSTLTLIIDHTKNVTLSIRGKSEEITLNRFQNLLNPIKIRITENPPSYSVREYTKKQ
ncbi:MAG: helix-turn-helix transcriptional regulator [Candidatus Marinimicrobia bacterium]|jgi:transcriptional regulator with XRE-family HTH domain|nr:helix-turn-helix transcriptional regulator [Candidatus Neomarinimicrobiota bacterium]